MEEVDGQSLTQNYCIGKHNFLRKTSALIECFCKLKKLFHHSPSTLVEEIFELSPINWKGGSTSTPTLLVSGALANVSSCWTG